MSILELFLSPGVLIGTLVGVFAAVALGKLFPEHDLAFFQLMLAVAGFVIGLILELGGSQRQDRDR